MDDRLYKRFTVCCRTVVLSVCPVCLNVTLVYYGQTVRWIKVKLSMEVGLGQGDIVLDGYPCSSPFSKRGHSLPIFGPCLLWPNGWMDKDVVWYGGRPRPKRQCFRWEPSFPSTTAPTFRPVSIVAIRSPVAAIAELLIIL